MLWLNLNFAFNLNDKTHENIQTEDQWLQIKLHFYCTLSSNIRVCIWNSRGRRKANTFFLIHLRWRNKEIIWCSYLGQWKLLFRVFPAWIKLIKHNQSLQFAQTQRTLNVSLIVCERVWVNIYSTFMDSLERQTQFHLEGVVAIVAMVTVAKLCLGNCCGHGGRHCGRRPERSLLLHDCRRLVRGGAHASSPPQTKTSWGCVCFSFCREQNDFTHTGRSRRMSEQVWRIKECLTETRWTTWVCDLSPHPVLRVLLQFI